MFSGLSTIMNSAFNIKLLFFLNICNAASVESNPFWDNLIRFQIFDNLKWYSLAAAATLYIMVIYYYRTQVSLVRSMGTDVWNLSLWNLTDVSLADEDTNSILTDKVNRTIQGNVTKCKWRNLVAKFVTPASVATWSSGWWPTLEPMQVVPIGGLIFNWCKWCPSL